MTPFFSYSAIEYIAPVGVAAVFIALMSLVKEPSRRQVMALLIAGAGGVYMSGGAMGAWEFAFAAVMTVCAYFGLASYRFLGLGWLLHTAWDVIHHVSGNPIIPSLQTSSLGCAVCDPVIALWCFYDAPPPATLFRALRPASI